MSDRSGPGDQHGERRVARLATATLITTLALVAVGGYTRGSGSGFGCADRWPLCEGGVLGGLLPAADRHMIIEWSHRWLAATVGLLALATAVTAWRRMRTRRDVVVPAVAAVAVVGFQAWVGRMIVTNDLDRDLVSVHLAISMAVVGLLVTTVVTSGVVVERDRWGAGPGRVRALWATAAGVYVLILLGSYVHNRYFPGWPLMDNTLVPDLADSYHVVHFVHRALAGVGIGALGWLGAQALRRPLPSVERFLIAGAAGAYAVNVVLGLVHVLTEVRSAAVVALHLAVAGTVWACLVGVAVATSRRGRSDRQGPPSGTRAGSGCGQDVDHADRADADHVDQTQAGSGVLAGPGLPA